MRSLALVGTTAITLTVTEANRPAVALYENAGFHTLHRFNAMILERESAWFGE
jgi:ribosomal protein S18 acetylase RimI-like enzyme